MIAGTDAERIAELENDNLRLRRLLDQRDAPGELRHRLRSTLSLLRSIIRRSADSSRDLPSYAAHLEDRLDALARAQAFADQHGYVDLRTLLAEELFHYGTSEGDKLRLSGPEIHLQPRAGQVLALAAHELAVNAVEHGALGISDGWIEISWHLTAGTTTPLSLSWKEHRPGSITEPSARSFGTEVLIRMLPYELQAETTMLLEPNGLRFTLMLPLPAQPGQTAPAES